MAKSNLFQISKRRPQAFPWLPTANTKALSDKRNVDTSDAHFMKTVLSVPWKLRPPNSKRIWPVPSCNQRSSFRSLSQNQLDALNSQIYVWNKSLHADSSRAGRCLQTVSKQVWQIPLLCVQWKTSDDGQRNCPKLVEFYSKNKFVKLMYLVGFTTRIYRDSRSSDRQMHLFSFRQAASQRPFVLRGPKL